MPLIHSPRRSLAIALAALLGAGPALANRLEPGLYEIAVEVELPNILRTSTPTTVRRCITKLQIETQDAFQIESDNPIARCKRSPIRTGSGKAGFQAVCAGGSGGYAEALFVMSADGFTGAIRMDMGGKNMTLIERQTGRRIGACASE